MVKTHNITADFPVKLWPGTFVACRTPLSLCSWFPVCLLNCHDLIKAKCQKRSLKNCRACIPIHLKSLNILWWWNIATPYLSKYFQIPSTIWMDTNSSTRQNQSSYQNKNRKSTCRVFLKEDTPLIKDAHKASQMSTFPFDDSGFLYIALQWYHVLLPVQVTQDKHTLRQRERQSLKWTPSCRWSHLKRKNKNFKLASSLHTSSTSITSAAESDVW